MAANLQIGDLLAQRYTIEAVLGRGGMGAVYKASDSDSKRCWAIKEMSDSFDDPEERREALASFKSEFEILCELDHPSLPRMYQSFEENGRQYIVMDLVEGQTVQELINKAPQARLSLGQVLDLAIQLADVLDYLHNHKPPIIFRDLKPGNIMVAAAGTVKLIDFGIARFFTKGKNVDTRVLGTPGYAAPEQYGRGQSDSRTDIYALGASLHHCLTGKNPEENMFSFLPPSQLVPSLPKELDEVILKCCRLKPDERWTSVKDFEQALFKAVPVSLVSPDSVYAKAFAINLFRTGSMVSGPVSVQADSQKLLETNLESNPLKKVAPVGASAPQVAAVSIEAPPASEGQITRTIEEKQSLSPFASPCVNFGSHYASEGAQKTRIWLQGEVDGRLETSENWLSCQPEYVKGSDVAVDIFVDPGKVNRPGQYSAQIRLDKASMLVSFILLEKKLSCWAWVSILFLTLFACLPYLGFVAPVILLLMSWIYDKELRSRIFTFFVISLILSICSWLGFELLYSLGMWLWEEAKPNLPGGNIFS